MKNLLHYTPADVFGLPGLDEKFVEAMIDGDKGICLSYNSGSIKVDIDQQWLNGYNLKLHLATDYTGDWRDSKIQRLVKIELGIHGLFWNNDKSKAENGYLYRRDHRDTDVFNYQLMTLGGYIEAWFKHFEPCDPATLPKRIEIKE